MPDVSADQVVDIASATPGLEGGNIDCKARRYQIGGAAWPGSCFDVGLRNSEEDVVSTFLGSHQYRTQLGTTTDPRLRARIHGSPLTCIDVDEHERCDRTFGHSVFVGGSGAHVSSRRTTSPEWTVHAFWVGSRPVALRPSLEVVPPPAHNDGRSGSSTGLGPAWGELRPVLNDLAKRVER